MAVKYIHIPIISIPRNSKIHIPNWDIWYTNIQVGNLEYPVIFFFNFLKDALQNTVSILSIYSNCAYVCIGFKNTQLQRIIEFKQDHRDLHTKTWYLTPRRWFDLAIFLYCRFAVPLPKKYWKLWYTLTHTDQRYLNSQVVQSWPTNAA
jgi:hypothetical protein